MEVKLRDGSQSGIRKWKQTVIVQSGLKIN